MLNIPKTLYKIVHFGQYYKTWSNLRQYLRNRYQILNDLRPNLRGLLPFFNQGRLTEVEGSVQLTSLH